MLRFSLRVLLKSPGFAATAILTMALGIGVSTAVFSIASAVLWRALPFADPGRLVVMNGIQHNSQSEVAAFSWPRFEFIRDHARSYTDLAAFADEDFTYTGGPVAERLVCGRVSASFFDLLGVHPLLGSSFTAAEGKPGSPLTVIVSHEFFTSRLNGDASIMGRAIRLNGRDYTVDGVLPPAFQFLPLGRVVDVFVPRPFELTLLKQNQIDAGAEYLFVLARLRPEISVEQARAEMDTLDIDYRQARPGLVDADPSFSIKTAILRDYMIADIRQATLVLMGAVGFVLMIACANVAGLLLARAMERKKEIAVRMALGAPARAIVRQLLFESLVLAALGGVAGIALSFATTRLLVTLTAATFAMVAGVHPDIPAALFAIAASVVCGVLFGLAPALELSKGHIESTLRAESGRGTGPRNRQLARNALIVSQVALSIVLLAGSSLLIRSFQLVRHQSPGFDPQNLLTVTVNLTPARYTNPAKQNAFIRQALDRIGTIPGVNSVAVSSALPVSPTRSTPMLIEGQAQTPLRARPILFYQMVTPDYAKTLRIPLVEGRAFTAQDDESAPRVAMVNQAFVRRYWPNRDALGASILLGLATQPAHVIGVLGDVKNDKLNADTAPEVLVPWFQNPWGYVNITVRTAGDPANYSQTVSRALNAIDPGQPVTKIVTMSDVFDNASREQRMLMVLAAIFSVCAFLISIVGLYGVIAYSVAQRTRELGVRVALGACADDITNMVIRQAAILCGLGIVIGIAGALVLTRLMAAKLYQISPADPVSYAASAVIFAMVAIAASLIPARRAARLNPVEALRAE
jgi:predicted permease